MGNVLMVREVDGVGHCFVDRRHFSRIVVLCGVGCEGQGEGTKKRRFLPMTGTA